MRSILLPVFVTGCLFASCKKNDSAPAKKEFIQLQKVEFEDEIVALVYNDQNQLTKIESKDSESDLIYNYIDLKYVNSLPVSAECFTKDGPGYHKYKEIHFKHDAQKRIAYVAIGDEMEDGQFQWADTVDYTFNSDNKLTKTQFRAEGATPNNYEYNSKGNYMRPDAQRREGGVLNESRYKFQYDNHVNPFSVNGLGILLRTIHGNDYFNPSQLLSSNNPTYEEAVDVRTMFGETNNPIDVSEWLNAIEYTSTMDENGGLKLMKVRYFGSSKQNGNQSDSYNNQEDQKYTCVIKQ